MTVLFSRQSSCLILYSDLTIHRASLSGSAMSCRYAQLESVCLLPGDRLSLRSCEDSLLRHEQSRSQDHLSFWVYLRTKLPPCLALSAVKRIARSRVKNML